MYNFSDSTSLSGDPQITLKTRWSYVITNPTSKTYYYQETVAIKINISYPVANLPFFPVTIPIKHLITYPDTNYLETEAKLYFTLYNSIEIWDYYDFINLPRNCSGTDDSLDTTRVVVSRNQIPQSDYAPVINNFTITCISHLFFLTCVLILKKPLL
ncbi:MAG: hypothetical protein A3H98_07840 [Bacteroidetes bacterium RIFCSPLOWO2_02_FULL_36_8]|nr:MAG: hypothetical protein A3H98_07840 [Bacteroidetes bacterium RIFCSPLOWO2_02_FULL_36_8]OFY69020.1 MAG: hypothetical protein A3G23_13135 [Bacteroidetes bacterium RIFCSPLOWO2_12_FULL_37_12]